MSDETDLLPESVWSEALADHLTLEVGSGRGGTITWFNHYSVDQAMAADVDVSRFRYVGVDGFLLRRLLAPESPRTSADLVLPLLLERLPAGSRLALIGSTEENLRAAAIHLEALPSAPRVVYARNGYRDLEPAAEAARHLLDLDVDVVVVGLGAPRQDSYVLDLAANGLSGALLATCGGWLDQVTVDGYYPSFAYQAKLNWLVRLVREPSRLWRRYTVDAVRACRRRAELRAYVLDRGARPFGDMVAACTPTG